MTGTRPGSAVLEYRGSHTLLLDRRQMVEVSVFEVERRATVPELLEALLENPWFDHGYGSPRRQEPDEPAGIHGPYELRMISPALYERRTIEQMRAAIDVWSGALETERRATLETFLEEEAPQGWTVLELPDQRAVTEHSWGWVVGQLGFLEFVLINPDRRRLHLLVGSDD